MTASMSDVLANWHAMLPSVVVIGVAVLAMIVDLVWRDPDADGVINEDDNCDFAANPPPAPGEPQADIDGDGLGDPCDDDADGDSIADADDNCPQIVNADQADADGDPGAVHDSDRAAVAVRPTASGHANCSAGGPAARSHRAGEAGAAGSGTKPL